MSVFRTIGARVVALVMLAVAFAVATAAVGVLQMRQMSARAADVRVADSLRL